MTQTPNSFNKPLDEQLDLLLYLKTMDTRHRLDILRQAALQGQRLSLSLVDDLLCLDFGIEEKKLLLEVVFVEPELEFEQFLINHLESWPQDLAVHAVHVWAKRTSGLLWHRMVLAFLSPYLSQRVKYTLLLYAPKLGGRTLVQLGCSIEGLQEFSSALHALMLQLATDYQLPHPNLLAIAQKTVLQSCQVLHPENKALASAVSYLMAFQPDYFDHADVRRGEWQLWPSFVHLLRTEAATVAEHEKRLLEFLNNTKVGDYRQFLQLWPVSWLRNRLQPSTLVAVLAYFPKVINAETFESFSPSILSGCPAEALHQALLKTSDVATLTFALQHFHAYLGSPLESALTTHFEKNCMKGKKKSDWLRSLPRFLQPVFARSIATDGKDADALPATREAVLEAITTEQFQLLQLLKELERDASSIAPIFAALQESRARPDTGGSQPMTARRACFNAVYRLAHEAATAAVVAVGDGDKDQNSPYWHELLKAWYHPDQADLDKLTNSARQQPYVYQLAYVNVLGRFRGNDKAVLKLLDYVRYENEECVRAVVRSLGGIASQRAILELIHFLTRPNVSFSERYEIYQILKTNDVSKVQDELRCAISDINEGNGSILVYQSGNSEQATELVEALDSLLTPVVAKVGKSKSLISDQAMTDQMSIQELDSKLIKKIASYKELSTEVKRALRTAQFFNDIVNNSQDSSAIDLSPVIDMLYKSLELLFRETYEAPCLQLVSSGVLQRKLDVIGYARPIPHMMDEFENYLSRLPVVSSIPFFSKFKLRKLLRGVCQYRPGQRFTLDGLKAFGMFFLCFGRQNCNYHLQGLFNLGLNDHDLAQFCKVLHVFQDARNRAAHEGFHPDAKNDMDGIWLWTVEAIQTLVKTRNAWNSRSKGHQPEIKKRVGAGG